MGKKVVRVFLDSNVILSGFISQRGAPRIILDLLSLGLPFLMGATGRYHLIEIERNLKKKMDGLFFLYKTYLPEFNLRVTPLPRPEELRGFSEQIAEKDIPVLLSAIRSQADFWVTGDKQHFGKIKDLDQYPFHVVTPSESIDSVLPEILKGLEERE